MTTLPGYQADGRPVPREAFYALACDPQRSVVVEACAGAGKTWVLVSRVLRALLAGAEPHEILAITFTRKAAGEMRERLNEWLREFAAPHTPEAARVEALVQRGLPPSEARALAPALAALHERVLCSGRSVEVRTFHAWFSQLMRAAPLELLSELGLHADMELIEDPQDHRAEVFRRFHAALVREPALRAEYGALVATRGRSRVRNWLEAAWDKRVEFELADAAGTLEASVPRPGAPASAAHPTDVLLAAPWPDTFQALARALGVGGADAQRAATALARAIEAADAQAAFAHAWGALFTTTNTPRKRLGQVDRLAEAQDALAAIAAELHELDAHLEHVAMLRLARVLLAEFAAYKRSLGLADMPDLERCGLALLRDATLAGWVQERLDARIRHVLIDEFQDTSPLQWQALHAWLSAYAGAGGGASGQRPPAVFIVGDPKQSIYRFRRAEPRVFEAAKAFVVDALGGTLLACDHTRRNAPEILAPLNEVFGAATAAGDFTGFRPHSTELGAVPSAGVSCLPRSQRPARATRAAGSAAAVPVWRDTLTMPRLEPDVVLRQQEADRVALAIASLVASGEAAPGEIFVLSRKRQSLRLVADALRRVHVPYAAVEELALMAAPEARDLVALLDALVSPGHVLSLAQALRSPLFGVSDADLIALAERAGHGDWWAALDALRPANAPAAGPGDALQRAATLLRRWRGAAQHLPPHDLLDRIVHEGEARERVAATVPAERRLAALDAIDALLAEALTLDGARYATPYNFVRALKRRATKVAPPSHVDAVQLLTVHGAKGLEAELVFVMDADPEPVRPETATLLIDWPVEAEAPTRCAFIYSEAACPASLAPLLQAEREARSREELNGLYVAMTRAKRRLVFSATPPHVKSDRPSWWSRIEPHAVPFDTAARPAPAPHPATGHAPNAITLKVIADVSRLPVAVAASVAVGEAPAAPGGNAATRLGHAVHRVLEWAAGARRAEPVGRVAALAQAAALEFGAPAAAVEKVAAGILDSAACARFFGGPGLRWAGNEVPVADAGEMLRIDRLVQLDGANGPEWWVLDYKLAHAPEQLAGYRRQLARYRSAVQRMQPLESVRCAFITGQGAVVEVDVAGLADL